MPAVKPGNLSYNTIKNLYSTANNLSLSNPAYDTHCSIMAAIGEAESSGNPSSMNGSHYGLWQIAASHSGDKGWPFGKASSAWLNTTTNAKMANWIYHEQGYDAWTTYTPTGGTSGSGKFKNFLPAANKKSILAKIASDYLKIGGAEAKGIVDPGSIPGSIAKGATSDAATATTNAILNALTDNGATGIFGISKDLFDVGFWKRVGIGLVAIFIMLIAVVILLRKPIENTASVATKLVP